ncbi:lytic polysaccharide monooxygenase [Paenibacillus thiaminolyticus]|uniref:lytic polysaccharide monooxygenase n=1 Tax=Paenibacillus thiaminolyticus TaxID=49283 RepID=UPI00232C37FC|nr:lytic polysaccharide monooxygenase [Paenibacillus thiaminolyticus]WCF07001.1 lytic polysaccharide monooxygenase [Paenibacillus thiaminolyticus]
MARQIGSTLLSKVSPLFTAFGLIVLGLAASAIFADSASAHGYIESPASRAYQCKLGMNTNCGQVQYEPQSVEAKGNFPVSGPADGHIAGGGIFAPLDEQSADRWNKVKMQGGTNTFQWHLTAPHKTTEWKYYITKKDWDPNKPLTRADLEPVPFCTIQEGGKVPPSTVTHECSVPTDRSGYHLILGVWEIADTGRAFYQVIDVDLVNDGSEIVLPAAPGQLAASARTDTSITLTWTSSSSSNGIKAYEVFRNGASLGQTTGTSYRDAGLTPDTTYTYTVRAIDRAGNLSPLSAPLVAATLPQDNNGGGSEGGNGGEEGGTEPPQTGDTTWKSDAIYTRGDRVLYDGLEYEAQYWTQNNRPDVSEAWKLLSDVILDWSKDRAYTGGDKVKHNGAVYQARWWTRGEEPGSADVWQAVK